MFYIRCAPLLRTTTAPSAPCGWRRRSISVWAGLTFAFFLTAHAASAQETSGEPADPAPSQAATPPSLGLRIEGDSPVARQLLEQELARTVGRPISSDEHATDGIVTLTFTKVTETNVTEVRVRYEPPSDQLLRSDVLPADTSKIASRVATLVQSLLRQDAGVTVVTPPPPLPSKPVTVEPEALPQEQAGKAADAPGSLDQAQPSARRLQSWRIAAGLRLSPGGSTSASGSGAQGRLTGDLWGLGGSIQATAPSIGRLRLGIEGVLESVEAEASLSDGRVASVDGLYIGVSAVPSFNVLTRGGLELNVSGHLGVIRTERMNVRGFGDARIETQGDVGYRVGLAADLSYWFSDHFGFTAAFGLDEVAVSVTQFRPAETSDETVSHEATRIWMSQPYGRFAALYRF